MKVFSACMRIVRKNLLLIVMYNLMFLGIGLIAGKTASSQETSGDFQNTSFTFTLINRDSSPVYADGIRAFLERQGEEKEFPDDTEALQDALFFDSTEAVIIVPQGFSAAFRSDDPISLEMLCRPSSTVSYYVKSLLQGYLRTLSLWNSSEDISPEDQVRFALQVAEQEASVRKLSTSASGEISSFFRQYHIMEYYILMVVTMLCVSAILIPFHRPDLRMRNKVSPLPAYQAGFQKGCSAVLCTLAIWALSTLFSCLIDWKAVTAMDPRMLFLLWLNSLLAAATAMSIAILASHFIRSSSLQNAAANLIALVLCFLGGVFVPLELLGEGIKKAGQYLPSYWYTSAVDRISSLTGYSMRQLKPVLECMAVQAGFIVTLLCISMVLIRYRNQAESSYGSRQTELLP